jgi:hypothetical protein
MNHCDLSYQFYIYLPYVFLHIAYILVHIII